MKHTRARAPCSRTNTLCKRPAEESLIARLRPRKVDSASESPSLPFRHVLRPRTPPFHGAWPRMRPCLTTVCLAIPCSGAGQGGPAGQASTTCRLVSSATQLVARVPQLIAAPYSPSCCGAATASLPRHVQPESERTAHDRHRQSLLCNAARGSAPGESLAALQ